MHHFRGILPKTRRQQAIIRTLDILYDKNQCLQFLMALRPKYKEDYDEKDVFKRIANIREEVLELKQTVYMIEVLEKRRPNRMDSVILE